MSNVHIKTDEKPPSSWSQTRRVLALVKFWHGFHPAIRDQMLKDDHFNALDAGDGIVEALLRGLNDLDPKRLQGELSDTGLLEDGEQERPLTVEETAELLGAEVLDDVDGAGAFYPLSTPQHAAGIHRRRRRGRSE